MVGILLIGDEILSGGVRESNLHPMVTTLEGIGYSVGEVRIVRDDVTEIAEAYRALADRYEFVISAGGIGPTHDDVTAEGVALALGLDLEVNPEMVRFLKARYGEPLAPMVARMAELPPGTEVLGRAEGHWPLIRCGSLFILPGLPRALTDKIARVARILPARSRIVTAELYLTEDESDFADWLDRFQRETPTVAIGSYPMVGDYDHRSRIVVRGRDRDAVFAAASSIKRHFRERRTLVRVGGILDEHSEQT